MNYRVAAILMVCAAVGGTEFVRAVEPVVVLPPAAKVTVDFDRDIKPILQASCLKCHSRGKFKGGFSLETREAVIKGGEDGAAVDVGHSEKSKLIELVASSDPDKKMPSKGDALTAGQIGLLRAWIDQGMNWPAGRSFGFPRAALAPRKVALPSGGDAAVNNPVDQLLTPYLREHKITAGERVSDRVFARRVSLDLIGLLPAPEQLEKFEADQSTDKRTALVKSLLDDKKAYADHWLTFWNDMLRNAYRGTGFIDGGRGTITPWLYRSIYDNKPYNQFVHELISPVAGSEAFTRGIVWRGTVNASQLPPVQAAQNVGQVFLGTNLKCASCHDSFVNYWKLTDAYALASVFSDKPLEINRCDKPTGKISAVSFIYPELGNIDPAAPRTVRMKQLADIIVKPEDGRLTRTIVNRLWSQLMGRGIVEPLDDMDQEPWSADLLDWLAGDLAEHGYDLKRTLTLICTSRAYQLRSVGEMAPGDKTAYTFAGPTTKRMTAEQFADAIAALTGTKIAAASAEIGKLGSAPATPAAPATPPAPPTPAAWSLLTAGAVRSALAHEDPLTRALGRPNRDQVVTHRESIATTLQALELTNGSTLDTALKAGAARWLAVTPDPAALTQKIYLTALGRPPAPAEIAAARELLGAKPAAANVEDLLWALTMLPEFQLIY